MWGGGVIIPFSVEFEQDWMDADIGGTLDNYKAENPTHKRLELEQLELQLSTASFIFSSLYLRLCGIVFILIDLLPFLLGSVLYPKSMMPRILKSGYSAMQLIHYFTAGEDEVKAWTIKDGWLAPQAAGVIHTDFERGSVITAIHIYISLAYLFCYCVITTVIVTVIIILPF